MSTRNYNTTQSLQIYLNYREQRELEKLGDRHEYAMLLWNITLPTKKKNLFNVDMMDAWEWKELVDESPGFLPHANGTLRQKIIALYGKIN